MKVYLTTLWKKEKKNLLYSIIDDWFKVVKKANDKKSVAQAFHECLRVLFNWIPIHWYIDEL